MSALKRGILLPIIFILIYQTACRKEETGSGRELVGVWVDIAHPADTLVFTREGSQVVLFDNSMVYRTGPSSEQKKDWFTHYIRLGSNRMGTRPYVPSGETDLDFRDYPFYWLQEGQRFSVEPGAFRPYLSCIGCPQVFERVR